MPLGWTSRSGKTRRLSPRVDRGLRRQCFYPKEIKNAARSKGALGKGEGRKMNYEVESREKAERLKEELRQLGPSMFWRASSSGDDMKARKIAEVFSIKK
jgi:hypothetical protein